MRITMTEIEAGQGYNDGPELRLTVQSNRIVDVRTALTHLSPTQRDIFAHYQRRPSDYLTILGQVDGYRFNDEWTFPIKETD